MFGHPLHAGRRNLATLPNLGQLLVRLRLTLVGIGRISVAIGRNRSKAASTWPHVSESHARCMELRSNHPVVKDSWPCGMLAHSIFLTLASRSAAPHPSCTKLRLLGACATFSVGAKLAYGVKSSTSAPQVPLMFLDAHTSTTEQNQHAGLHTDLRGPHLNTCNIISIVLRF